MLKVLTINSHDSFGGAARAAYNCYMGLRSIPLDSKMLVATKARGDFDIIAPKKHIKKFISLIAPHIDDLPKNYFSTSNENLHSSAWFSSIKYNQISEIDPDIIHLHWVQGGALSIKEISKIKKPIVWTLHDMWPFSGAEHYSNNSERYKEGYKSFNRPKGESGFDLNRWVWKRKKKYWNKIENLTIAAPSNWMAECARESVLFKDRRVEVVHVGLDHNLYRPIDKVAARKVLNIPQEKKIILIGALNFFNDKRKGGMLLKESLKILSKKKNNCNIELYVMGISKPKNEEDLFFKTNYFGFGRDDLSLVLLYSASDVFVSPSTQENFSAMVFESLSCGLPSVAFDIGGMPDMINHKGNGYLARAFDTKDLAEGVDWVLNEGDSKKLSDNARNFILTECTLEIQAKRYHEIYKSMI